MASQHLDLAGGIALWRPAEAVPVAPFITAGNPPEQRVQEAVVLAQQVEARQAALRRLAQERGARQRQAARKRRVGGGRRGHGKRGVEE